MLCVLCVCAYVCLFMRFGDCVSGMAPKEKIFHRYVELELQLGNIDRCRALYERFLQWAPAHCDAWIKYAELEKVTTLFISLFKFVLFWFTPSWLFTTKLCSRLSVYVGSRRDGAVPCVV